MKPHGSRGKKGIGSQFIAHRREMRLSVSWRMLTGNDKLALERLEEEHMAHGGRENGNLHVTFQNFVEAGVRRNEIAKVLSRLQALGFIEIVDLGRASRAEFRFPASYRLTYVQGNIPATDEWMAIVTTDEAERRLDNALAELKDRTAPLREKLKGKSVEGKQRKSAA